jgi:hypothetical protein
MTKTMLFKPNPQQDPLRTVTINIMEVSNLSAGTSYSIKKGGYKRGGRGGNYSNRGGNARSVVAIITAKIDSNQDIVLTAD